MREHWLVISHEASNSGAPRVLLDVLRGIRAMRPDWSCDILLRRGGVLQGKFAELGRVHLLPRAWSEGASFRAGVCRKFFDRPLLQPRRLAAWMKVWRGRRFDLVYNNTATNGYLVSAARSLGCPILTHGHELAYAMRRFQTPTALAHTLDNTDRFVAVSGAVAADLIECGASPDLITVVPNFLTSLPTEPNAPQRAAARAALNLPADAAVITGCGHIHWIKGTDLFVETAAVLAGLTRRKLQFVWVGGESDKRFAQQVRRLVRQRQLENVVRFVGAVPDATPWFVASDAVTVTSRFESFPLVSLEASALARPVLGFAAARGLNELLADEPQLLVPALDPRTMAMALLELLEKPEVATARGQRLRQKVAAEYMAAPRIRAISEITAELVQRGRSRP
jgi:glycosyltransferase involved in cell wall biosynthesis